MKRSSSKLLFSDVKQRARKAGQPPGTFLYTGEIAQPTVLTYTLFNAQEVKKFTTKTISSEPFEGSTWINVVGLKDISLIQALAHEFKIHPLTIEDILNVQQRPKVEEFDDYLFITLRILHWEESELCLSMQQVSIILGEHFILSFQETESSVFDAIEEKLEKSNQQNLRQQSCDYLVYRLLDAIVDEYFVLLEKLGEQIENVEAHILSQPSKKNAQSIYRLKHDVLLLRKSVWPLREVMSHLLYENVLISKFTRTYLRDLYDHTMQSIDTIETFRDILLGILDMYLSSLTIRMNEIMKTLTIITTIFIPITALSSVYGMNLPNIPLMRSSFGFGIVASLMITSVVSMMIYFRRKKWI